MQKYLLCALCLCAFTCQAAPYAIPEPDLRSCSSDEVLQELTDNISNGTLTGEKNLLLSLNFVESCQDLINQSSAHR